MLCCIGLFVWCVWLSFFLGNSLVLASISVLVWVSGEGVAVGCDCVLDVVLCMILVEL